MLDLGVAVLVGIAAAVLIAAVRTGGTRISRAERRWGMPALLLAGGLAVGLLAQLAELVVGDSQEVLFSG